MIGTTGRETPFLPESQLPPCARLSGAAADADAATSSDGELARALAESAKDAEKSVPLRPDDNFDEAKVKKVMSDAGSSRAEAVEALRQANGSVDMALVAILARGLSSPK